MPPKIPIKSPPKKIAMSSVGGGYGSSKATMKKETDKLNQSGTIDKKKTGKDSMGDDTISAMSKAFPMVRQLQI